MNIGSIALAVALLPAAFGQWLDVKTAGVPRLADGKPNLTAPAPRLADGRPDLSGLWNPEAGFVRTLAKDLKPGEVPMQAWAETLYKERLSGIHSHEEPDANCLPQGVPKIDAAPAPWRMVQTPGIVFLVYEAFTQWRQVFTDGRALPKDPSPTWFGYSVGKYEGDTLVVDTSGFHGASVNVNNRGWLDQEGHPSTDALHVTERFRRKDFGHMDLTITIDDPKAYTKPWTVVEHPTLLLDSELLEFICLENEKDIRHLNVK